MDVPIKNLIARNYKHFTFDMVLWRKWKLGFNKNAWLFNIGEGPKEHTYRIRLGRIHITIWKKSKEVI